MVTNLDTGGRAGAEPDAAIAVGASASCTFAVDELGEVEARHSHGDYEGLRLSGRGRRPSPNCCSAT
jgi:hypothetical protein